MLVCVFASCLYECAVISVLFRRPTRKLIATEKRKEGKRPTGKLKQKSSTFFHIPPSLPFAVTEQRVLLFYPPPYWTHRAHAECERRPSKTFFSFHFDCLQPLCLSYFSAQVYSHCVALFKPYYELLVRMSQDKISMPGWMRWVGWQWHRVVE